VCASEYTMEIGVWLRMSHFEAYKCKIAICHNTIIEVTFMKSKIEGATKVDFRGLT